MRIQTLASRYIGGVFAAAALFGAATFAYASDPTDEAGWTVLSPAAGAQTIYVSSSTGSDTNNGLSAASPVKSLTRGYNLLRDGQPDWLALTKLFEEYAPKAFVVGMPTNADDSKHPLAARVARFCNQLRGRYRVPIETVNEFLSSVEAQSRAHQDPSRLDAVAAQVILETWLNEVRRP